MPSPEPVALLGELLATQAKVKGAAAVLVDAAVRDTEDLRELGLPVWTRWIRVHGANRTEVGAIDEPVEMGGTSIAPGDAVVLDSDGAVIVARVRIGDVLRACQDRAENEREKREQFRSGVLSYDLYDLRRRFEDE
jgi:4-hydroxy-4-methyl-2-oxoglutarate aldolase